MATLVLAPIKDTFVAEYHADTPRGADIYVQCQAPRQDTNPATRSRAILAFDLSALPATAAISSATLYLRRYMKSGSEFQSYTPFALSRHDWLEAEATWYEYRDGAAWDSAGGDYGEPECDAVEAPPVDTYFDVLPIALAAHAAGTTLDILIRDTTEVGGASATRYCLWYSRDWGTESQRPLLTIEYTLPPPPPVTPYVGLPYRVEVHDSAGNLIAIPRITFNGELSRGLNMPDALSFSIPANDPAARYMTPKYEVWVRDLATGDVLSRCKPIMTEASNG